MSRAGQQREYNIAVLGAGGVGKSALTAQFVQGIFIERYDPTIEDTYRKGLDVDGRQVMLEIMDTAGTEQFTSIREMYMRYAQGFLIVFSITSASSLEELFELRQQIVNMKQDPSFPVVLVGNKADLEEDRAISKAKAFQISQAWGVPYYETSARRRLNVQEVFVDVCRQIIRKDLQRARDRRGHGYGHGQNESRYQGQYNQDAVMPKRQRKKRRNREQSSDRSCVIL